MKLRDAIAPTQDEKRYFRLLRQNKALRDPVVLRSVLAIKDAIAGGDHSYGKQLWDEFDHDEQIALHVAPKYGGIFTTAERDILHGNTP